MNQNNTQFSTGSGWRLPNRLETFISISIIAILLAILAILFLRQADTDISRFGITAANLQSPQKPAPETENSPAIPISAGFDKLSQPEVYDADNLYEKINGKAPLYTEAGFLKLYCQRLVNKGDTNLWMEVFLYDMGNMRNAFSVYSMQKRAEADALLAFGQMGYKTTNGAYFVHGKFYAEIVGSSESQQLVDAMVETSAGIQNTIAAADLKITELDLFPSENLVPGSAQLYLKNAFGFEGLTDIFTARYKIDAQEVTVFFSRQADPQNAEAMAESYHKFLVENGATVKQANNEILKGKVFDFYGVTEIVFAKGLFVVGVHEAENQDAAEKAVTDICG